MKKAISVSLVLVAISLIGFVLLQVNWVINIVQTQEQKIRFRVEQSAKEAADSLSNVSSVASLRLREQGIALPNNNFLFPYIKINQ
ncbi:hypothetical protein, partial [Arachidicoccus sp.]|uniref:hypothetical protein n=1 Tax=Arachidicoccus sp. TaxID=1872624 RepID=UPI003D21C202